MAAKVIRKVNFTYLGIALFLIALSVGIGYYVASSVIIKEVSILGLEMTDENELREFLHDSVIGIHSDSLAISQLRYEINSRSYVQDSRVFISPTGRMAVEVTERKPIALLIQGDRMVLVDDEGVKMPLPSSPVPDLPLLFGFNALPLTDTLQTEAFKATANFLNTLHNHPIASLTISEVGWHAEHGVIALSREQDVQLIFGDDNFEDRIDYWSGFYQEVVPRKGLASYRSLDFRYRGQIIAKNS